MTKKKEGQHFDKKIFTEDISGPYFYNPLCTDCYTDRTVF